MVDFNEVRPHDALGGKTPAELYRDSPRRSLTPLVPSYPPEWKTRRVSRTGNISVNDDVVFVSTALAGQTIGLQQEHALRWRARFFDVDLGPLELIPSLSDVFDSDTVSSPVSPVRPAPIAGLLFAESFLQEVIRACEGASMAPTAPVRAEPAQVPATSATVSR